VLFTEQGSTPASPSAGDQRIFLDSADHHLKRVDSSGSVTDLEGGGGGTGDVTWAIIQAMQFVNEVMNFPSMESADGAQPEWWEEGTDATLTEEDVAGESLTETYGRCLKVVTTADNAYGYQRYTYADQPRTKAGRKLSAIFAVWSVSSAAARIRLQSSVGSLAVSSDATAAAWTVLTVEDVTLDGTYVDIRCEVDTGTAYFVPLGVNIGEKAVALRPRGLAYRENAAADTPIEQGVSLAAHGYADLDCTAQTSPLACRLDMLCHMFDSVDFWRWDVRRNGDTRDINSQMRGRVISDSENHQNHFTVLCDDTQTIETALTLISGSGTLQDGSLNIVGWWEWE
jgi:hypothetical protein